MEKKTLKEIHEDVPPDYYDTSMKVNLISRIWHRMRFRWISRLVSEVKGSVLDIGCDGATLTSILADKTGARLVVGMDISREAVAYSKNKLPQIEFTVGHAEELPFQDATFDMIFCSAVLEHVEYPDKLLAEMKRCLKKDGYCIVEVPTENLVFKTIWLFWTRFGRGRAWHHAHVVDFRARFGVKIESVFIGMLRAVKIVERLGQNWRALNGGRTLMRRRKQPERRLLEDYTRIGESSFSTQRQSNTLEGGL